MSEIRNLWDALPVVGSETGGVWHRIEKDAASRTEQPSSTDFDYTRGAGYEMAGVWDDIEDETLLLRPAELGVWFRLERAVAASRPSGESVWEDIHSETLVLRPAARDVWRETSEETLIIRRAAFNVWDHIHPRNVANFKPRRTPNWALKPMADSRGKPYFILKHTRSGAYIRLTPEQHFLWDRIDGQSTVKDIALAYLLEYKSFDIGGVLEFLKQLGANEFLSDPDVDVYTQVDASLQRRRTSRRVRAGLARLLEIEVAIKGIDRWIARLYRVVGPLIYNRFAQAVLILVALAGLAAFGYLNLLAGYTPLDESGQVPWWVLVSVYVVSVIVLLIHESAHALTVKHFKREVRRGGFILYLGFPAWFVDTSDIWLSPRRARILVSFAGPYSGIVLAGLFSLIVLAASESWLGPVAYTAAFSAYIASLFQFNPLFASDGYYMLMDRLEIPRLRERAMTFVRGDLWKKIRARESFGREDGIFTVFGILSLIWTLITLVLAVLFWEGILKGLVQAIVTALGG